MTVDNMLDYSRGKKRPQRLLLILAGVALVGIASYQLVLRIYQSVNARMQVLRVDNAVSELLSKDRSNQGIVWSNISEDGQLPLADASFVKFSDGEMHVARKSTEWLRFRHQIDYIAGPNSSALNIDVFGCIGIFKTISTGGGTVITVVTVDHLAYAVDSRPESTVVGGDTAIKIEAIANVSTFRSLLSGKFWVLAGVDKLSLGEVHEVKRMPLETSPITVQCRVSRQESRYEYSRCVAVNIDGIEEMFVVEMRSNGNIVVSKSLHK
jgi:hypothetical protein